MLRATTEASTLSNTTAARPDKEEGKCLYPHFVLAKEIASCAVSVKCIKRLKMSHCMCRRVVIDQVHRVMHCRPMYESACGFREVDNVKDLLGSNALP